MADITEKIAKLLALAGSPNENEARAALLKARKLMAEHKLRPEDFEEIKEQPVIQHLSGVFTTKLTTPWAVNLASTIAKHYCCRTYRSVMKGKKRSEIGFIGFEQDAKTCALAFSYAFNYVMRRYQVIKKEALTAPVPLVRRMCHSYGWGFCVGLEDAFAAQTAEHQEWGLVMVVPKAVEEVFASMKTSSVYGSFSASALNAHYTAMGRSDGRNFQMPESGGQLEGHTA